MCISRNIPQKKLLPVSHAQLQKIEKRNTQDELHDFIKDFNSGDAAKRTKLLKKLAANGKIFLFKEKLGIIKHARIMPNTKYESLAYYAIKNDNFYLYKKTTQGRYRRKNFISLLQLLLSMHFLDDQENGKHLALEIKIQKT